MEENKNLADLSKDISNNLCDTLAAIEILYDLNDGKVKECHLLNTIQKNVRLSFENIEICRKLISHPD